MVMEVTTMKTKNIILKLRTERGMSQDELADKIMVTRQAVSRWENGDTVPNTDTLKLLSKEFDVSINTLLGEPRKLFCQCCGMPIDDDSILGRDKDGTLNEEYCKWCYVDGTCKRSRWFCGDQTIKSRGQNKYRSQLLHGMQNGGIPVLIAE